MSLFNELKASLEEAVAIQQQRQPAARVTRYEVADVKAIRAALEKERISLRAFGN